MRKLSLVLLSMLLLLSACDPVYTYTYKVSNQTDVSVCIEWATVDQLYGVDTVAILLPAEAQTLYTTSHGVEPTGGPFFQDVAWDLAKFIVSQDDTLFSQRDYLANEVWQYEDGVYHAVITEGEFE